MFFIHFNLVSQTKVELSYKLSADLKLTEQKALYDFAKSSKEDYITMRYSAGEILKVIHVQGREKQEIPFEFNNETLKFTLPDNWEIRSQVQVIYQPDNNKLLESPFTSLEPNAFFINALNVTEQSASFGQEGFFYPVIVGSKHFLNQNITLKYSQKLHTVGKVDFKVVDGNQCTYFSSTNRRIRAGEFYFLAGNFESSKAKDIVEEFDLDLSEDDLELRRLKERLASVLEYYSKQTDHLFLDDDLLKLKKANPKKLAQLFLQKEDFKGQAVSEERLNYEKALALIAVKGNEKAASELHFNYHLNKNGAHWEEQMLLNRWENYSHQGDFFWDKYCHYLLKKQEVKLSLKDTSRFHMQTRAQTDDEASLSFANALYQFRQPLKLTVAYKYSASKAKLFVYYAQADTNLICSFKTVVDIVSGSSDSSFSHKHYAWLRTNDTLQIDLKGSPKAARTSIDKHLPITITEKRPQNYWLYELTLSDQPELQNGALEYLLETSKGNLLATVMGIALDSGNPELQLKALHNFDKLDVNAKQRLHKTIGDLSKSTNTDKVKKAAFNILSKYYQ